MTEASLLSQTDRLFFAQTSMDVGRVSALVRDALQGADDGELYLEYAQSETLLWDDGKLKEAGSHRSQGFGLRSVVGELSGFAHSVELSEDAIKRAAETVVAVKKGYAGTLALRPAATERKIYTAIDPVERQSFEAKITLLREIDAYVRAADRRVRQVSVSLGGSWKAVQIIGGQGDRIADIRPLVFLRVSVVVEQDGRMESGASGGGGRVAYDGLILPESWKAFADEALRKAVVNLDAVDSPAGEMTVVLGVGWPAVLLHEAVGHGLEGDFNRKKTSAFSGLMGQRIAAKGVTVVDDGTIKDCRGSLSIDDEGTPTQCTTLIEDGVLVGYMQDRLNARLMGVASTGNGRRESFAHQPMPRMTNTIMRNGTHSKDEIISSVKQGIYAADFGGGQVDITSGKFVFSATEAYKIEDGKITAPIKGASLVGTGFEALKHITMVGNDCELDKGIGTCGKGGQVVPVGIGQPTLRLENMTVGGRG